MSRLRRVIDGLITHELERVIDDGDSEVVPADAYFNDVVMSQIYYTNDAKNNYYSSSD